MSKLWNANNAGRAQRLRLVEPDMVQAGADLYADGYAAARLNAVTEFAADRAMLVQMIEAASCIELANPEPLATLLAETVLRLLGDVVGAVEIDGALLRERALALSEAIHGPDGPVMFRVHPDCVAMLDGVRDDICVCGDVALEIGQVVMIVGGGFVEDGVQSALDRVRATLALTS